MLATLTLAAALIGGPTSPPPVAAVHDAAPWQSIPGPVTLAPKCTGCALEMVVSGIGMENSTGPINMQQNSPPVRANWTWTSDNGMVVFGAVYSPDDRDGECHVVGDVCEEDYYCVTRMELIIYNVGLMRVVGDKA